MEGDILNFRYFDGEGNPLTYEQLLSMSIVTPAMEHVFATVTGRVGKTWKPSDRVEKEPPK